MLMRTGSLPETGHGRRAESAASVGRAVGLGKPEGTDTRGDVEEHLTAAVVEQ